MRSLIAKEWRENRTLCLAFLVLAPAFSLGIKWLLRTRHPSEYATASVLWLVPGLFAFYLVAVASDLVAAESASGRAAFFAALPVRPGRVWAAKALFLYGSAILYLGYVLALESAVLAALGRSPAELFGPAAAGLLRWLLFAAVGGAAALFMSALLDRGLAAAFGSLFLLGGLVGIGALLRGSVRILDCAARPRSSVVDVAAVVALAGLLLGSFLAFSRGRIHLPGRLRRVGIALGVLLLVLAAPTAWAEMRLRTWMNPSPGDRGIRIQVLGVGPGHRYAVICACRAGPGPFGLPVSGETETWAMSLADGRTRELAKGVRSVDHFSRDGDRVALEPPPGSRGPIVTFDLTTGRECGSRPFPPPAGGAPRPGAPQPGGYRVGQVMSWAYLVYRYRPGTDPGTESTLVLRPGGQRFPLPRPGSGRHWYTYVLPDVPSETLLVWEYRRDEKGYHRVVRALRYRDGEMGAPLATDAIFSFEVPGLPFTILIARDRRAMLVDLRTATVRPLPELAGCRDLVWSKHARYFLARLAGRYRVGELDSDGTVRLRPDLFPALGRMPDWFDGEAAILVQWGTSRLTVVTADGHRRSLTPVKQR